MRGLPDGVVSRLWPVLATIAVLVLGGSALALEPDEVVLIANRAMPQSVELARLYAAQRNIPDGHIIELNLPATEEMGMERFDAAVVMPIRQYLKLNGMRERTRCLVTFYGVPLRLMPRKNSADETVELRQIQQELVKALASLDDCVIGLERAVVAHDRAFKPQTGGDLESIEQRADQAMSRIELLSTSLEPEARKALGAQAWAAARILGGPASTLRREQAGESPETVAAPAGSPEAAGERDAREQLRGRVAAAIAETPELLARRMDPAARQKLRQNAAACFGVLELARLLHWQIDYLEPDAISAFDSELPLLWYNQYAHKGMLPNPLAYRNRSIHTGTQTLMVMRMDAPQAGQVREMIMGSKLAERKGLSGRVVIDSRGMEERSVSAADRGYAPYDKKLRRLADLVRAKTKLSLMHDDGPAVLGPGAASDVALYCGWYELRHYVPSCTFVPGAVGFHIASFEMISLRNPGEKGWCRGLLNDGIASTLGAVDEPTLGAFPDPEEFFGVLLTGRLTLAETYWLTNPLVSWKMTMIGDPLYRPFAAKPALRVEDLPPKIREILEPESAPN